jgi:hypothetical protein
MYKAMCLHLRFYCGVDVTIVTNEVNKFGQIFPIRRCRKYNILNNKDAIDKLIIFIGLISLHHSAALLLGIIITYYIPSAKFFIGKFFANEQKHP